jgi:hypothetical protein
MSMLSRPGQCARSAGFDPPETATLLRATHKCNHVILNVYLEAGSGCFCQTHQPCQVQIKGMYHTVLQGRNVPSQPPIVSSCA